MIVVVHKGIIAIVIAGNQTSPYPQGKPILGDLIKFLATMAGGLMEGYIILIVVGH